MFSAFDVDQSLLDFVKTVDLPKVHPGGTIQDIMDCLTNNGIDESWHMVGLHVNGFKKDTFKNAFVLGACMMSVLVCGSAFRCCCQVL